MNTDVFSTHACAEHTGVDANVLLTSRIHIKLRNWNERFVFFSDVA